MTASSPGAAAAPADPLLTACDIEPIHIPGAIQPFGIMLVAKLDGEVIGAAGDVEGRLTPNWSGRMLDDLLGPGALARLSNREVIQDVRGAAESLDASAHQTGDLMIVELEPSDPTRQPAARLLAALSAAAGSFERAASVKELAEGAASSFQQLTGFDRVMVYQFLEQGAGVVLAEAAADGIGSFLNHHFPATDIPKQARALYVRNRVRTIGDVHYQPAPLRSASTSLRMLDLSDAVLRSVSPVHIQYLKNMAVGASASISIVKDGVLWGLIACHHRTPRVLTLDARMACDALAAGLARQIRAKEEAEQYRERIRMRTSEDAVMAKVGPEGDLAEVFGAAGDDLCRMMKADTFAVVQGREIWSTGRSIDKAVIAKIAKWAGPRSGRALATDALPAAYSAASAFKDQVSGLLAVRVELDAPTLLMWMRAETLEVVKWAGDPHKATVLAPGETLTPRASFEAWSETVSGRSRPWSLVEIEAAERLAGTLTGAHQVQLVRRLNEDLKAADEAKGRLLAQKDLLMKEVSHRVQNSLQLVSAFLALQGRAQSEPGVAAQLDEARRRIGAVAMVHRRLYADDRVDTIDLARYLEDLIEDLKSTMDEGWRAYISYDLAPVLMSADRAVNVGLVVTELVINANKYAYGGAPGPISILLEQHRSNVRLVVADKGVGRSGERKGFGSRMLMSLIERLSGELTEGDNGPGLRISVLAPIGEADEA